MQPSQSAVWGILPLRVESGLAAQKLESWRRWGLSEQFGPVGDNSSGERTRREIIDGLAEQARRYSRQIKVFSRNGLNARRDTARIFEQ